jgi:hypothetical protein
MGEKPILGQVAEQHVGLVPKGDSALPVDGKDA